MTTLDNGWKVVAGVFGYPINPDPAHYTRDPSDGTVFKPTEGNRLIHQSITITQPTPSEVYVPAG